ncbi:hypothetical protein FQZ97_698760 [compost metagenome]
MAAITIVPPAVVVKVPGTTVRPSPSRSVSLASRSTTEVNGVSSTTVIASSTATGGSFAGVIVMVAVAVLVPPSASVMV